MTVYKLGDVSPNIHDTAYVAPNAQVMGQVTLAENSSVWFGAVLRGDNDLISIGARSNVQDNSVLHTDPGKELIVGEDVIIGHQVMLHGCTIGDNTLIGIGATILNDVKIGKNCLIGAHALITEGKVIPDGSMIVGAPGKIIRQLSAQQIAFLKLNADVYVANAKRFADELEEI